VSVKDGGLHPRMAAVRQWAGEIIMQANSSSMK
jgi:hypothetical protein